MVWKSHSPEGFEGESLHPQRKHGEVLFLNSLHLFWSLLPIIVSKSLPQANIWYLMWTCHTHFPKWRSIDCICCHFLCIYFVCYIINLWTIWSNTWIIHSAILQPDIHRTCVSIWVFKQPYHYMLIIFKKKKKKKTTRAISAWWVLLWSQILSLLIKRHHMSFALSWRTAESTQTLWAVLAYPTHMCSVHVSSSSTHCKWRKTHVKQNKNSWKKKEHNTCITQHLCICTCFP